MCLAAVDVGKAMAVVDQRWRDVLGSRLPRHRGMCLCVLLVMLNANDFRLYSYSKWIVHLCHPWQVGKCLSYLIHLTKGELGLLQGVHWLRADRVKSLPRFASVVAGSMCERMSCICWIDDLDMTTWGNDMGSPTLAMPRPRRHPSWPGITGLPTSACTEADVGG